MKFISQSTSIKGLHILIVSLLLIPAVGFAAHTGGSDAVDLLTRVSFFIKTLVIPALFSIAFLYFLINMVRYFIIGATNEESKVKARRSTLYGIIAFVFLISLWGVLTLLLNGLGFDRNNTSLCPDYLEKLGVSCGDRPNSAGTVGKFGSVNFPSGSGGTGGGGGTGLPGGIGNNGGSNGGKGTDGANNGGASNFSGLSELVFGTGKDSTAFDQYTEGPRAIYETPVIASNATCDAGLNTLLFANRVETTQAAYALYKDISGATTWMNLSDLHSANHISFDADALSALRQTGASDIYLIHTHPRKRTDNLSLTMEGNGPSSADLKAVCANNDPSVAYAVVDWNGIWTYDKTQGTCPYSPASLNMLPVIETYTNLASLESSTRISELADYVASALTPSQYKQLFSDVNAEVLSSMTPQEIFTLTEYYQTLTDTSVSYQASVDAFCGAF